MNPDILFNRLEQRTERELFRRSFKAAADSQDSLFKKFENRKRELMQETMIELAIFFNGVETLFLVISGITFIGIYLARLIIWALKQ